MAITIDGSGSVTGISVGGLPDGIVDTDMLAANAVTLAKSSGRKILQVLTNTTQNSTGSVSCSTARTYYDVPDQNVTITPTSNTSKVLISFHQLGEFNPSTHVFNWALERGISGGATTLIQGDIGSDTNKSAVFTESLINYFNDNDTTLEIAHCSNYLDSPATTSAVTYKLKIRTHENITGTYYYNRTVLDNNANHSERGLSWITVMEVSA